MSWSDRWYSEMEMWIEFSRGSVLLSNIVSTKIHHWKFKIVSCDSNNILYLGIQKYDQNTFTKLARKFLNAVYYCQERTNLMS